MNNIQIFESLMAPVFLFFLFGGGAIVVGLIIVVDFFRRRPKTVPYLKWITVVVLSIAQAGCWEMMANFDRAFGNYRRHGPTIVILTIVWAWLLYQFFIYLRGRRKMR